MMLEDGARIVALRMGEAGSIVASRDDDERHFIEAIRVPKAIDPTGAGNTYCGSLLLGLLRGKGLSEAGVMATVAGSFCVEQPGALKPEAIDKAERDRRVEQLLATKKCL
jgi:sugar/nucleoside kinase (ribokinase family)